MVSERPLQQGPFGDAQGSALVMVLLVASTLFALGAALLFQTTIEREVAVNEQDHMKALAFAEAGLIWAERRILDHTGGNFTTLLLGPDDEDADDDNLLGLRDLSLTLTTQITAANESTASAVVQRDFDGTGNKSYEAVRLEDGSGTRALVYVRVDDNYDDDPTDPANDDPLSDADGRVRATVVAEYPVFVGGSGVESANVRRSRARRIVTGRFSAGDLPPAILVGGDLKVEGHVGVCGACGSLHLNGDLEIKDSPEICGDATASGLWVESGSPTYGGLSGGGYPTVPLPAINPYDTAWVPPVEVFDTTALSLPGELRCAVPSASDPGNAKYFAFVADDDKGLIFKAYWDLTGQRWEWKLIDDLSDAVNVQLDDCGRDPGDAAYGSGVDDEKDDEFYGWKLEKKEAWEFCTACGVTGEDASLCDLANNDFGVNGYYHADSGILVSSVSGSALPALPGSFAPDSQLDFQPGTRLKDSLWLTKSDYIYSPLYNAVIFYYGNVKIDKELAKPGREHCSSVGCGAAPGSKWMASLIVYGDLILNKRSYHGPANPGADYDALFIVGRDIKGADKVNETVLACGSGCSTPPPAAIGDLAGIVAAHEQVELQQAANYFGRLIVEDAIACSNEVDHDDGHLSKLKDIDVFYDCANPSGGAASETRLTRWQEVD